MEGSTCTICVWLTAEEADELLGRCLTSEEGDTPAFQRAILKLARAAFADAAPADFSVGKARAA
jgi:hypothetical protein